MNHLHRVGAPTAALLVLALVSLALSACGGGSSSTESSGSTSNGDGVAAGSPVAKLHRAIRQFGSEASGAKAPQAEAALTGYFGALAAADWGKACSYLTKPVRTLRARAAARQMKGESCTAGLRVAAKRLSRSERDALAEADISSVRIEGDRGFVIYRDRDAERAMPLRAEGGSWKLAAARIAGPPLGATS
ncbi:MAG TPA: hypothetical protein VFT19_13040 [Solirubrobacterales bacterium]|nr:hypothetical protein [Solirubrobacterales bacterium]